MGECTKCPKTYEIIISLLLIIIFYLLLLYRTSINLQGKIEAKVIKKYAHKLWGLVITHEDNSSGIIKIIIMHM